MTSMEAGEEEANLYHGLRNFGMSRKAGQKKGKCYRLEQLAQEYDMKVNEL